MRTYLQTKYDSRKSFCNKAEVETAKSGLKLYSYNTFVAEIENGVAKVYNLQSTTTVRHVKEFLLQNGYDAESKKQIERNYFRGGE